MDEKRLHQLTSRLGADAAERLDVEATARAVVERLRTEPVRVPWWRQVRVLQSAAAAVVILAAGLLVFDRSGDEIALLGDEVIPVAIESLSADELEEVVDSLFFEAPVYEQVAIGLQDLDESQLVELLQLMEG